MKRILAVLAIVVALVTGAVTILTPTPAQALPPCGTCSQNYHVSNWFPPYCNDGGVGCMTCTVCGG